MRSCQNCFRVRDSFLRFHFLFLHFRFSFLISSFLLLVVPCIKHPLPFSCSTGWKTRFCCINFSAPPLLSASSQDLMLVKMHNWLYVLLVSHLQWQSIYIFIAEYWYSLSLEPCGLYSCSGYHWFEYVRPLLCSATYISGIMKLKVSYASTVVKGLMARQTAKKWTN